VTQNVLNRWVKHSYNGPHKREKVKQGWNGMRVSKWWADMYLPGHNLCSRCGLGIWRNRASREVETIEVEDDRKAAWSHLEM